MFRRYRRREKGLTEVKELSGCQKHNFVLSTILLEISKTGFTRHGNRWRKRCCFLPVLIKANRSVVVFYFRRSFYGRGNIIPSRSIFVPDIFKFPGNTLLDHPWLSRRHRVLYHPPSYDFNSASCNWRKNFRFLGPKQGTRDWSYGLDRSCFRRKTSTWKLRGYSQRWGHPVQAYQ